jgi:hypothetical protein
MHEGENPLITPKLDVEVWKVETLELQDLENQGKKTFNLPNLVAKLPTAESKKFSAFKSSATSLGGSRNFFSHHSKLWC